jgi:hypothetical protein
MRTALLAVLLLLSSLSAKATTLGAVEAEMEKGAYNRALQIASTVKASDRDSQAKLALLQATAHAKLQAFDKALPFYRRAERLGSKAPNLPYDFGQALFATQNLKEAEAQFKKSIVKPFKQAPSAYYVGYIRQLLEDKVGAQDFYSRIQKLSADPDFVKQPALYQIAEVENDFYDKEKNKARRLKLKDEKVLPLYRAARDFESGTPAHEQAKTKIEELEREIAEVYGRMVNGNPLPRKAYSLRLSQELGFDSNVITEADEALIEVSNKDSFLSKTSVLGKYQFNWRRRFSFVPELSANANLHSRRSTPRVYQNDSITIAPALRSKWEHFSRGKAATGLFDVEFNLMLRDYEAQHKFPYYSRSLNFVVGERVTWFATGSTTLKLALKFLENYNPERNSYSPAFTLQQNVKLSQRYDLQNTFTADYLHARNDFNDERNYKLRHSVTLTKLIAKIDVTPSLSFTLKDTMKQKGTRGNELLFNPNLSLSREIIPELDGTFEYSYSKNYSKAKDTYQYTKHELKLGAGYNF